MEEAMAEKYSNYSCLTKIVNFRTSAVIEDHTPKIFSGYNGWYE